MITNVYCHLFMVHSVLSLLCLRLISSYFEFPCYVTDQQALVHAQACCTRLIYLKSRTRWSFKIHYQLGNKHSLVLQ